MHCQSVCALLSADTVSQCVHCWVLTLTDSAVHCLCQCTALSVSVINTMHTLRIHQSPMQPHNLSIVVTTIWTSIRPKQNCLHYHDIVQSMASLVIIKQQYLQQLSWWHCPAVQTQWKANSWQEMLHNRHHHHNNHHHQYYFNNNLLCYCTSNIASF